MVKVEIVLKEGECLLLCLGEAIRLLIRHMHGNVGVTVARSAGI